MVCFKIWRGLSGFCLVQVTNPAEQKWKAFFENPNGFWDNRSNKRNPKAPDFRSKTGDTALWLDSRDTPPWVPAQLVKAGLSGPVDPDVPF